MNLEIELFPKFLPYKIAGTGVLTPISMSGNQPNIYSSQAAKSHYTKFLLWFICAYKGVFKTIQIKVAASDNSALHYSEAMSQGWHKSGQS